MSWIHTFTGRRFYPLDPDPEQIDIMDIAHALSNIGRFTGHASDFYSVAQHCVAVANRLPPELAFEGLMHDASEAYLNDLAKPIKVLFPDYVKAERRLQWTINARFGLPQEESALVKEVDTRTLVTEALQLMPANEHAVWRSYGEPFHDDLVMPYRPPMAKWLFLKKFQQLTQGATQ